MESLRSSIDDPLKPLIVSSSGVHCFVSWKIYSSVPFDVSAAHDVDDAAASYWNRMRCAAWQLLLASEVLLFHTTISSISSNASSDSVVDSCICQKTEKKESWFNWRTHSVRIAQTYLGCLPIEWRHFMNSRTVPQSEPHLSELGCSAQISKGKVRDIF